MIFILTKRQNLSQKVESFLIVFPTIVVIIAILFSTLIFHTATRGPLRDEDCYWDYGKARCAWAEHCEYRSNSFISDIISFQCA